MGPDQVEGDADGLVARGRVEARLEPVEGGLVRVAAGPAPPTSTRPGDRSVAGVGLPPLPGPDGVDVGPLLLRGEVVEQVMES